MFKNVASQKIQLFAFDATTGLAKTGDAANLTAYVSKDYGAVTVLGDTSATEADATNAPGWYLFDLTQSETNADELLFTGKSSTANVSVVGRPIATLPNRFATLVIDAAGLADANMVKAGPTGSGTAQTTGDIFARLGAPAGASVSADIAALQTSVNTVDDFLDTEVAAIKAKTDNLPSDPADASDIAAAIAAVKVYADRTVVRGTVSGTSPTTTSFTPSALSPNGTAADQFKGRIIIFDTDTLTAALQGQATDITANTAAALPVFTFSALSNAPASGDTFTIV